MNYVNKNVNFSIDQEASSDPILEGGKRNDPCDLLKAIIYLDTAVIWKLPVFRADAHNLG